MVRGLGLILPYSSREMVREGKNSPARFWPDLAVALVPEVFKACLAVLPTSSARWAGNNGENAGPTSVRTRAARQPVRLACRLTNYP